MEDALILTNAFWLIILVVGFFIGKNWLKNTVQYAIKHEYDVMLETIKDANLKESEEHKRQYEIRMKSALIAELMAEWISHPQDMKRLRQLTNEAFLWLPSELATELSKVLSHKPDAIDYRELMCRIRKHLLGSNDDLESFRVITYDLTHYEIAEIARKQIDARTLVKFDDSEKAKPLNQGRVSDNASL
ncbi:hypothetical protein PUG46_18175 [Erwiniaceae bacterium L1_55_4]|nr:hypothetical protein [Erwiniaceae bacterium L1_55_4]